MQLIGHQKQWQFLKKTADSGKLPHAYLFQGEEQLGKKTLAIEFAKYLNCENRKSAPCQICRPCQDIQKRQYPDFILIEPKAKEIQIVQIRELSWKLSLRSYWASFKIAIIDSAHLMNQEAQNCFLKTLEEPKGNTLLMLVSEFPEMLFTTILSRVQKIRFYPVSAKEIEKHLKDKNIPLEKAQEITHYSYGRPGRAISFLSDSQKLENYKQKIKEIVKIGNSDFHLRFQYAKDLSGDAENVKEILDIWLRFFRKILMDKVGPNKSSSTSHFNNYSTTRLKRIIELIQNTNHWLSNTNINTRLALEILMLEL